VAAERAAIRVAGVKAVVNQLESRLPSSSERTDEDLARTAINSLKWSVLIPQDQIKVKVSKGWVTLPSDSQPETLKLAMRHDVDACAYFGGSA
jgi:osmotically-inducible protein OsmY